jgi:hypothetical protein
LRQLSVKLHINYSTHYLGNLANIFGHFHQLLLS